MATPITTTATTTTTFGWCAAESGAADAPHVFGFAALYRAWQACRRGKFFNSIDRRPPCDPRHACPDGASHMLWLARQLLEHGRLHGGLKRRQVQAVGPGRTPAAAPQSAAGTSAPTHTAPGAPAPHIARF